MELEESAQLFALPEDVGGTGRMFDINRNVVAEGALSVALDSVALFETNVVHTAGAVAGLGVLTGASLALSAYCAANPKACFGSCPTFYVDGRLEAEGFSSSVLPRSRPPTATRSGAFRPGPSSTSR